MAALGDAQIAGVLKAAGFPDSEIGKGVAIALAESGGDPSQIGPKNRNGTIDYGLMQINTIHNPTAQNWADPKVNAAMAFKIWSVKRSWQPWSTYNSGAYLKYLVRGNVAAGHPDAATPGGGTASAPSVDPSSGLSFFTNSGMWARVGVFILGGLFLLFGIWKITGVGDVVVGAAKGVVSARTGGLL